MNYPETIFDNNLFSDSSVNVVNTFTGKDMTVNTYYFNPSQATAYQSTNNYDECYCFYKGTGKFYLNNGTESVIDITDGSIVYVPNGVVCKIEALDNQMIAVVSKMAYKR